MYNIMISNNQNTPMFLNNCGNLSYYKSINLPTEQQLANENNSGAITVFMPPDGKTSFNTKPLYSRETIHNAKVLFFKSNISNEISTPDYGISISDGFKSYNNNAKLLKIIDYIIVKNSSVGKVTIPAAKTYNTNKLGVIVNSSYVAARSVNNQYGQFISTIFDFSTANTINLTNAAVGGGPIVDIIWGTRIEFLVVDLTNVI